MKSGQHLCLLNIIIVLMSCLWQSNAGAQNFFADSLVAKGDSLRMLYRFERSSKLYSDALDALKDTIYSHEDSLLRLSISDKLLLSENGRNMSGFVHTPTVIARHKFSTDDFFLYYPLKDRSWRLTPNQLDSSATPFSKAIYAPVEDMAIYFSAEDERGVRNLYRTEFADTVWTRPALLGEHLTSDSDEIYPMLSADGKSLFFASKGLFGVGGYDLYVSHWDEKKKDWGAPENMGFPYSSPANDYLLIGTDDGKYTIFASDRGCPKDSVWVYVLECDRVPVRSEMTDPEQLRKLALLEPQASTQSRNEATHIKSELPENVDARKYMDQMGRVRALKDSIAVCESKLAEYRERYSVTDNDTEKKRLTEKILHNEALMPDFRSRLEAETKKLQEIEMDFLFSGVVIDPGRLLEEAEREIVSETPDYTFSKMSPGEQITLELETRKEQ